VAFAVGVITLSNTFWAKVWLLCCWVGGGCCVAASGAFPIAYRLTRTAPERQQQGSPRMSAAAMMNLVAVKHRKLSSVKPGPRGP
jgi:hypothetical protein